MLIKTVMELTVKVLPFSVGLFLIVINISTATIKSRFELILLKKNKCWQVSLIVTDRPLYSCREQDSPQLHPVSRLTNGLLPESMFLQKPADFRETSNPWFLLPLLEYKRNNFYCRCFSLHIMQCFFVFILYSQY